MSLYNNVAENLKSTTSLTSGLDSGLRKAASYAENALGGSTYAQAAVQGARGMASYAMMNYVNNALPAGAKRTINNALEAKRYIQGLITQEQYWDTKIDLMGGITPRQAKQIYSDMRNERLAKKNLWFLEVTSALYSGDINMPTRFNLFATNIEYSPFIVEGDKAAVGGAKVDLVSGAGAVELTLTTMDDDAGSLKRWFAAHHAAAAASDGTMGEPGKYAVKIRILHSTIFEDSSAYRDVGYFRPDNLQVSLSRAEDALEELQMTFSQLDTFMRP